MANLPAEVTHLFEEVQAKDELIQEARRTIASRDNSLQKFIKLNGSLVQNPKEEPYSKLIKEQYERSQILQEEKIGLVEKAAALVRFPFHKLSHLLTEMQLDRHVKRLDIKLKSLQDDGSIPTDPQLPSLLRESPGNMVPPSSLSTTGANTPLQSVSGNQGPGGANLAHAAIARISNATNLNPRLNPNLQNMTQQALLNQQRLTNQQSTTQATARQEREMSAGSDSKRRRPNLNTGPLPGPPSSLGRASSMGPGTPKPATPGSRAGSVGPGRSQQRHPLMVKKAKPQQPLRKAALTAKSGSNKKRRKGGSRASPSTTADDESVASEAGTEDEEMSGMGNGEGDDEEDETDNRKYCTCQRVSFGDMVACDNDNCKHQWFHWECVGIKEEPVGDWLCPECSKLPPVKIKRAPRS